MNAEPETATARTIRLIREDGYERGKQEERERIVEWLRRKAGELPWKENPDGYYWADAIERKEHEG